jgi:TetR/AcrR family transcriptional regulator, tetracycline repressor protein
VNYVHPVKEVAMSHVDAAGTPGPTARRSSRPRGLSRDQLARAALDIVDERGMAGLNARAVAARLDVAPSALYKHVTGMDSLVDLVLDRAIGELDVELAPELAWREQLEVLARRLRDVLRAHPGIAAVFKGRDPLGPNSDRLADAFARVFLRAGFSGPEAGHAWYTVVHYVIGFEATFAADRRNLDRAYDERELAAIHSRFDRLDAGAFPGLRELGRHIWAPVLDQRFDYGLGVLLDGLALRAQP